MDEVASASKEEKVSISRVRFCKLPSCPFPTSNDDRVSFLLIADDVGNMFTPYVRKSKEISNSFSYVATASEAAGFRLCR